jgi:hypothetical protein
MALSCLPCFPPSSALLATHESSVSGRATGATDAAAHSTAVAVGTYPLLTAAPCLGAVRPATVFSTGNSCLRGLCALPAGQVGPRCCHPLSCMQRSGTKRLLGLPGSVPARLAMSLSVSVTLSVAAKEPDGVTSWTEAAIISCRCRVDEASGHVGHVVGQLYQLHSSVSQLSLPSALTAATVGMKIITSVR